MNNERFKAFAEDFFNAEIKKERTMKLVFIITN